VADETQSHLRDKPPKRGRVLPIMLQELAKTPSAARLGPDAHRDRPRLRRGRQIVEKIGEGLKDFFQRCSPCLGKTSAPLRRRFPVCMTSRCRLTDFKLTPDLFTKSLDPCALLSNVNER